MVYKPKYLRPSTFIDPNHHMKAAGSISEDFGYKIKYAEWQDFSTYYKRNMFRILKNWIVNFQQSFDLKYSALMLYDQYLASK